MIARHQAPERPPRAAFGLYKRVLLGALVLVLATATAGAAAVLLTLEKVTTIIGHNHPIELPKGAVTEAQAGDPQTLLVLGSDHRFGERTLRKGSLARSDTIMLIHLDPHAAATTVLSIPRDLKIDIPGHGPDKINAAYSLGGPAKVLATVKELLGPNVPINHVINVKFHGFQKLVNYVDWRVRRRRPALLPLQRGSPARPGSTPRSTSNPATRSSSAPQALAYVRYRHTDSDFVRAGRQQDFLRQVKDQIATSKLLNQHADDPQRRQ